MDQLNFVRATDTIRDITGCLECNRCHMVRSLDALVVAVGKVMTTHLLVVVMTTVVAVAGATAVATRSQLLLAVPMDSVCIVIVLGDHRMDL